MCRSYERTIRASPTSLPQTPPRRLLPRKDCASGSVQWTLTIRWVILPYDYCHVWFLFISWLFVCLFFLYFSCFVSSLLSLCSLLYVSLLLWEKNKETRRIFTSSHFYRSSKSSNRSKWNWQRLKRSTNTLWRVFARSRRNSQKSKKSWPTFRRELVAICLVFRNIFLNLFSFFILFLSFCFVCLFNCFLLQLNESMAEKERLEKDVGHCTLKLERAEKIIGGLGGEKERWTNKSAELGKRLFSFNR